MTRAGVSITKSTTFRGVAQEFANTYYYESAVGEMTGAQAEALIDALVALEKPMHSSDITFVRARCWSTGQGEANNVMLFQKSLSGAGTSTAGVNTSMDRERAFLVRIRAGNDSKGRPVYLRKYWHLMVAAVSTISISAGQLQNTSPLNSTQRAGLEAFYNSFKTVTASGGPYVLCAKSGRQVTGDTIAHPYLEHHQLGEMWR